MPRRKQRGAQSTISEGLKAFAARAHRRLRALWASLQPDRGVQVEVLVSDDRARRSLEAEVRRTLRRLERVLGPACYRGHTSVVVQQVIRTNRQLAGCYQLGERPDGSRFALIRLALRVNGRRLDLDEVLAALAEQWIGLWFQESQKPSVLVPLDLDPSEAPPAATLAAAHRADLFSHSSNGKKPPTSAAPGTPSP